MNPTEGSYARLGEKKAPKYITWSFENRSQLIRIPAAKGEYKRIELRSPDPTANPYIAYALLIYSGLDGILNGAELPEAVNLNLYEAKNEQVGGLETLPNSLAEAKEISKNSEFVKSVFDEKQLECLFL